MHRLVSWIVTSILLWVFVTASAIALGEQRPYDASLAAYGLDFCDGVPCYLGMVPGRTGWRAANERIAEFQPIYAAYEPLKLTRFTAPYASGYIVSDTPDHSLSEVAVAPLAHSVAFPTLLDLLLLYGVPCNVYTEQFQPYVTLIRLNYPHMSIDFPHITERLSWDRRPDYINIKPASVDQCAQTEDTLQWRGAANYQQYRR
jgi:hypothetical protein